MPLNHELINATIEAHKARVKAGQRFADRPKSRFVRLPQVTAADKFRQRSFNEVLEQFDRDGVVTQRLLNQDNPLREYLRNASDCLSILG